MKTVTMIGCSLLLMFSAIQAEAIPTLHIGPGAGDPCATGCGGHPNSLPSGSELSIYQTSNGQGVPTLTSLYLIAAVPNYTGSLAATISALTSYNPYLGSSPTASSNVPVSTTNTARTTLDPGEELYTVLGFTPPFDKSNSFVNYEPLAESILGTNVTLFGLYLFDLTGIVLGPQGLVDVAFSSGLPTGTIVTAIGTFNGTNYETAFTEAGAVVPEPSTLLLLGSGLLGLGGFTWRRNRKG